MTRREGMPINRESVGCGPQHTLRWMYEVRAYDYEDLRAAGCGPAPQRPPPDGEANRK